MGSNDPHLQSMGMDVLAKRTNSGASKPELN